MAGTNGETGSLAGNGYRVYFATSPIEPSYDMTPPGGAPYVQVLGVGTDAGSYVLAVDLIDQTFSNPNRGRETRYLRHIRIERQCP